MGSFVVRDLKLFTPIPTEKRLRRFSLAVLTAVLAVLLRWLLDPVLGHVAFYVTVYVAAAYCGFFCGLRPAMLSSVLGFAGVFYWFVDPRRALWPVNGSEIHGVVGWFLVTALLILLGEASRSMQLRLNRTIHALTAEATERQRAEAALRKAHAELERRVRERTSELSEALSRLESEITVREQAEAHLRHLSVRLMTLQDEERRRIARDLHDTAGQTLAAIKMSIALVRQLDVQTPGLPPLIEDLNALADEALQEVRTTSYLLHPPLLDEAGIASAARWFVEGFARRSGIAIACEIPEKLERPPRECELVLFRILQESLTNVHRHSAATSAVVRLNRFPDGFHLEISDNGQGISEDHLRRINDSASKTGVGIQGMRERARELGGTFEIASRQAGTTIRVALPFSLPEPWSPVSRAVKLAS